MTEQKLTELLRHAYQCGRDNGSNRGEKNFNDFLQTEAVKQALSITDVVGRSEQLESGLTCMMCRKPKDNDGHTCCEECAGLAF